MPGMASRHEKDDIIAYYPLIFVREIDACIALWYTHRFQYGVMLGTTSCHAKADRLSYCA